MSVRSPSVEIGDLSPWPRKALRLLAADQGTEPRCYGMAWKMAGTQNGDYPNL